MGLGQKREAGYSARSRELVPYRISDGMERCFRDDACEDCLQTREIAKGGGVATMRFHYPLATTRVWFSCDYCCVPHSGQNLARFAIDLPHSTQNFTSPAGDASPDPAADGAAGGVDGAGGIGFCGDGPPA